MLKTNVDRLVMIAVEGRIAPALVYPNEVGHDGQVHNVPALGGITHNVFVGDPAFGWMADHVEPCASTITNFEKRNEKPNVAYNFLACIGNEAIVVSGDAKGKRGVVTGHHGGVEHVIIDFPKKVIEKLSLDDRVQIRAFGQGLKFIDHPEVVVSSIDPALAARVARTGPGGRFEVGVCAVIPAELTGSGLGESCVRSGDIDFSTADAAALKKHGLAELKLGDIVAISDCDASFGWCYRKGAVTVGVVIHGDSHVSGHGPGVSTIMTSATGKITAKVDKGANIGRMLGLGRYRKK
jgi:hypothetical protein